MNLSELTVDLNTFEIIGNLADEIHQLLVDEHCADQTALDYVQRLRAGEMGYVECIDQLCDYLKTK